MYGVRPPYGLRRGLGDAEMTYLPGLHQLGHDAPGLLDGHVRVDAVLVVEVDVVDAEPAQRRVARGVDVLGAAVEPDEAAVRPALVAELGGDDHVVTAPGDRGADEL